MMAKLGDTMGVLREPRGLGGSKSAHKGRGEEGLVIGIDRPRPARTAEVTWPVASALPARQGSPVFGAAVGYNKD